MGDYPHADLVASLESLAVTADERWPHVMAAEMAFAFSPDQIDASPVNTVFVVRVRDVCDEAARVIRRYNEPMNEVPTSETVRGWWRATWQEVNGRIFKGDINQATGAFLDRMADEMAKAYLLGKRDRDSANA